MKKIRILLADDHSLVRIGLATLLKFQKDLKVVGGASDGEEAVRLAGELKPDVVIMDLMMPVLDGVEATRRILAAQTPTPPPHHLTTASPLHLSTTPPFHPSSPRILILTSFGTSVDVSRAIQAGASGALMKDIPNNELIDAIRAVANGEKVFSPEIQAVVTEPAPSVFTDRQLSVLDALAKGLSNKEIASLLGISSSAVKQHLIAIFAKLGASNRADAVSIALRKHLLKF